MSLWQIMCQNGQLNIGFYFTFFVSNANFADAWCMYFFSQLLSAIEIEKLYCSSVKLDTWGAGPAQRPWCTPVCSSRFNKRIAHNSYTVLFQKGLDYNHDSSIFQGVRFYDRLWKWSLDTWIVLVIGSLIFC